MNNCSRILKITLLTVGVSLVGMLSAQSDSPQTLQKFQRKNVVRIQDTDLVSSFGNMSSIPLDYKPTLHFNPVVKNNTSSPVNNVQIDFILSRDKVFPMTSASPSSGYKEDMLLHRWVVKELKSTATKSISFGDLSKNIPPGEYFIAMIADPDNSIRETNEKNNIAFFPVKIGFIHIQSAYLAKGHCNKPYNLVLVINGTDFGNKDEKSIRLGPHKLDPISYWTKNQIESDFDVRKIPKFGAGQEYEVYLTVPSPRTKNGLRISNVVKVKTMYYTFEAADLSANPFPFCVCPPLPATQGTFKVMVYPKGENANGRELEVIFWSGSKVTVKIPSLPFGFYNIYIEKHGKRVGGGATYWLFKNQE